MIQGLVHPCRTSLCRWPSSPVRSSKVSPAGSSLRRTAHDSWSGPDSSSIADIVVHRVPKKVHDISVVGNGYSFFLLHIFLCHTERLCPVLDHQAHPAWLGGSRCRKRHLRYDAHAPCDLYGFRLCAAHPAKAAGHEQMADRSPSEAPRNLRPAFGIGVEGSVHDTLRSMYIGLGSSITEEPTSSWPLPSPRVIEHAHHQAVGPR